MNSVLCGARGQTDKTIFFDSATAHQVEPETPTFGGREQRANKARDDPVLRHRRFLAHQHLGVVATLKPACVSAIHMTRTYYPLSYQLAAHCT